MEKGAFFYSTNGTDIVGPVTEDQLRQLWKDDHLGTGSFLWREGEPRWTRLVREPSPELMRVRSTRIVPAQVFAQALKPATPVASAKDPSPSAAVALLPPPEAAPAEPAFTPAVPAAPESAAAAPEPAPVLPALPAPPAAPIKYADASPIEDDAFAVIVNTMAGLVALAGAGLCAFLAEPPPGVAEAALSYRIGGFAGSLAIIVLIPYFLAWMAKGMTRIVVRAIMITGAALLCVAGQLGRSVVTPQAEARAMSEQQKQQAQKEIANKGYYTADSAQAERNIQKLKGQLTDGSETSRIGRDVLAVTTQLLAKVKASDAVEAKCKFTLDGVTSADDLAAQIGAITMLRAAQNDVVIFLEGYDQHCRDALTADQIAPATQNDVIEGAHKGAHVDLLITLWQEKVKLSEDHVARFVFLQRNWGAWQLENGQVTFADDGQATGYDLLVETIEEDVGKIRDTQKQIFK